MCLMSVTPKRGMIPADYLKNAFDHNSDGFGVMYAEGGRVVAWKERGGFEAFQAKWNEMPCDKTIAVHFRFGTSGPETSEACHPFEVLNKERDGMDLWLMHNGVLDRQHFPGTKQNSDTMQYVGHLRAMLQGNPTLIRKPEFRALLERDLGTPNKIILLEGNGRWHYLNRGQGKDLEGVWYSNEYSLCKVYSGHGKGRMASRVDYSDDDWAGAGYYDTSKSYYRGGIASTLGINSTDNRAQWALQILRENGKVDEQVFWKKGYTGWLRMGRNASTGAFYRDFWRAGEISSADMSVIQPPNSILFYPKSEAAWERGDKHSWIMEAGDHVPVPAVTQTAVTLYSAKEAKVASAPLLDLANVPKLENALGLLCPETHEACMAQCTNACTGAASSHAGTFSEPEDEEESEQEAYLSQFFGEANLKTLSEDDMWEAVCDYPERATIALGCALNCAWAFEEDAA